MAGSETVVVLDAEPLIHLDQLGGLRLLGGFAELLIPSRVWKETLHHRPALQLTAIPGARLADPVALPPQNFPTATGDLHAGELAALTLLHEAGGGVLLSDDDAARQAAVELGFTVSGTLGLILRGVREAMLTRSEALDLLSQIPARSTLHASRRLLERVAIALENETPA
jgi:predicted nucleic acid-binding protein